MKALKIKGKNEKIVPYYKVKTINPYHQNQFFEKFIQDNLPKIEGIKEIVICYYFTDWAKSRININKVEDALFIDFYVFVDLDNSIREQLKDALKKIN